MPSAVENIRANISRASLKDALLLILVYTVLVLFIVLNLSEAARLLGNALSAFIFFMGTFLPVFLWWLYAISRQGDPERVLCHARISFAPVALLLILLPYNFFYIRCESLILYGCLALVLLAMWIFDALLRDARPSPPWPGWRMVAVILAGYAAIFGGISLLRHWDLQDTRSFDLAIYNQIQWNNIHGHFFESSASGSNFATHNSPFLLLLSPLYALYPCPENLLILKTIFLTLSAIPFYLIVRHFLTAGAALPFVLSYLFFPFIIGQNFNAPHEVCFLPLFLLFSYYFFIKDRWRPFLLFLIVSLSFKEHMAMVAVMYGVYALYLKKPWRWVIIPIVMGIIWAVFSIWLIGYFQTIYQVDPHPAWLLQDLKAHYIFSDPVRGKAILSGLRTSNFADIQSLGHSYLLFAPLLVVLPFLSAALWLGIPELLINNLSSHLLIYPTWQYCVVISCFALVACIEGVRTVSSGGWVQKLGFPAHKAHGLLAWLICLCVAGHFFLWAEFLPVRPQPQYVQAMNDALRMIPATASVSTLKIFAAQVSGRREYFLLEDGRKGEYILLGQGVGIKGVFADPRQASNYGKIFDREGIEVYKEVKR